MGKCFSIFLTGLAIMWFCRLDHGSMGSWPELVIQFKNEFRVHIEQPKDVITLTDIKQRNDESLKNYITRSNTAATIVQKPDPTLVHMAIVIGVKKGTELYKSLTKMKTRNLSKFYKREDKYLRLKASKAEGGASSGKIGKANTLKTGGSQA